MVVISGNIDLCVRREEVARVTTTESQRQGEIGGPSLILRQFILNS